MRLDIPDELVYWFVPKQFKPYIHAGEPTFARQTWWLAIGSKNANNRGLWRAEYPGPVTPGLQMSISVTLNPKLESGTATAIALWYNSNGQFIEADEIGSVSGTTAHGIGLSQQLRAPQGAARLYVDFRLWNAVGSCKAFQFSVWPETPME